LRPFNVVAVPAEGLQERQKLERALHESGLTGCPGMCYLAQAVLASRLGSGGEASCVCPAFLAQGCREKHVQNRFLESAVSVFPSVPTHVGPNTCRSQHKWRTIRITVTLVCATRC